MIEIEKPKVDIVELSEDYRYGKFVVEPLERGYGITIGNALRNIIIIFTRCISKLYKNRWSIT